MSQNVLHVENVTMQFGGVVAVNNLSMDINEGEIVALIGPNGAGKTTAFNCITGVYEPTNGRVDYMGKTIVENYPTGKMKRAYAGENNGKYTKKIVRTPDKITQLGIARTFQNIRLFKSQSVFNNVLIAMHMRRTSNVFTATFRLNLKEEHRMREEAMELLKIVGLDGVADELATSLPYGQQRRLEIVRALATHPKLLLLDEPTTALDVTIQAQILGLLKKLNRESGISMLFISHNLNVVRKLCRRVAVMQRGVLVEEGDTEEVFHHPQHPYTQRLIAAIPTRKRKEDTL